MAARHGRLALIAGLIAALLAPATVAAGAPAATPRAPFSTTKLPAPEATPTEAFAPGRLLVKFKPGVTAASRRLALTAAAGTTRGGTGGATLAPLAEAPVGSDLVPGLAVVETSLPVEVAVADAEAQPGVEYAEPDRVITASLTPNDPGLPSMWGLDQPNDDDIDAKAAWATTTGSPSVVVAVIDSGIQHDQPDLAANIWTNPGEIAGNGIDDDGDGYIDDVHGWDFVDDDNLPDDPYGHGTHVAGTIAAVGNNGIGVVGVAYASKVMPLRILDANGSGYVSDAVRALDFATRHGVRISNNSWGYQGGASQVLRDAIAAAGDAGQLVVVAAGNSATDIDQSPDYPGSYDLPNIVTVAAMDRDNRLSLFSNIGAASVDIAAPGEDILSTLPTGYGYSSGTSMASPHVAGVAALVLSA
ncbi:MAG TPA: S8 family peptidase, partial [Candidatus Limnocylindrales bacterium]